MVPSWSSKCSGQASVRGLKSRMNFRSWPTTEPMSVPFERLHRSQDKARFGSLVSPRCLRLMMWSTSHPASVSDSGIRQYSHRKPAREATSRRSAGLINSGMPALRSDFRPGKNQEVFELFVLVQLTFLVGCKPLLPFLVHKLPYPSTCGFRRLKVGQGIGSYLSGQKLNHFVRCSHF